jgi:sodium-dependent dicarboxylate transporter 2/3/5
MKFNSGKLVALVSGPLVFAVLYFLFQPEGLSVQGRAILAGTAWIAIWWITEAIPIPATSLLPIVIFPISGAMSLSDTTSSYGHSMVFLYMGGFMIALAMEKWNLHRRIALNIIKLVGTNVRNIVLGFMISSAFISMWISNTATTMMMFPIALAVARQFGVLFDLENKEMAALEEKKFGISIMLGIAWASSIGGMSTLIGTPTNAIFSAVIRDYYNTSITFSDWMLFGLPVSILILVICWIYLTRVAFKPRINQFARISDTIDSELASLGKITPEETKVLIVFLFTAISWITRSFLIAKVIPGIDDTIIAIAGALVLFVIPAGKKDFVLDWDTARRLPWGILLLFGGGLAIANGFSDTGLAEWIGNYLKVFSGTDYLIILAAVVVLINLLTEITSNVATISIMLPIIASIAGALELHPFGLMIAAAISASCAYMLPVSTPPNAIVFSSGYIKISEMAKTGFLMNIISIIIIVIMVKFYLPLVMNLPDLQVHPVIP